MLWKEKIAHIDLMVLFILYILHMINIKQFLVINTIIITIMIVIKKQLHQWKKRKIQCVLSSTEKQCSNNLLLSIKKRKQNQETDNKKLKFSHHMLLSKSWFIVLHNIHYIPFLMYVAFVTIIYQSQKMSIKIKQQYFGCRIIGEKCKKYPYGLVLVIQ